MDDGEGDGLHTLAIVLLLCGALKLLHTLGLINTEDASTYAHYLFNAFDSTHSGSIKFEDFVTALSILLRGSTREKLQWTFNLYDINKDGYINKEDKLFILVLTMSQEMTDIVRAIYDMMGKYTYPALKTDAPKQHVDAFFQVDLNYERQNVEKN
ncbi:hypothetical protein NFI96_003345 [Prochilodus magdalenae]|nr:hypothetical protein NFI96_003345 [Prochilodus magdalenae]